MTATAPRRATDPDALAALEEQRDFLLRSLDDLEAEHDAGDLDDDDYRALKDDYTARAASVLRAIDDHGAARRDARRRRPSRGRTALVVVGVVVVGVVAGLLVAQAAGRRDAGENITGGGGGSTRELLAQGDDRLGEGDVEGALEVYGEVLAIDPDNVDALLHKATAQVTGGEVEAAIATYDEVLGIEPDNVEALAYQGSLFHQQGDTDRAVEQIDRAIDTDPTYIDGWSLLVAVLGDAGRIDEAAGRIEELAAGGDADIALAVAQQLTGVLPPVDVLKVYDALLAGDPGNAMALTYRAWQSASLVVQGQITGDDATTVLTQSLELLDEAVAADPTLPDALVFRAIVLDRLGRTDDAADALRAFDAAGPPAEMQALVDQFGLRDRLGVEAPGG